MRVVYDTNVAATILLRRGKILKLKQLVKSGKVTIITSEFILAELAEVLHLRLGMTKQRAKASLRVFAKVAEIVKPTSIEAITRDPDDDYIIATAVSGNADCIVTLDDDLLVLKLYKSTLIVNPDKFEDLINSVYRPMSLTKSPKSTRISHKEKPYGKTNKNIHPSLSL